MQVFTHKRYAVCGLLLMLAVLASGCATSRYGEQITTVNHYPQCYEPIQALRDADSDFNKTVAASTVVGVLGGALIGFLATGKAEGAAIGAAAGGVAGAGVGYAKARQERIADDNKRMASYLVDIDGDISGIDRATAAARVARDCYNKQFALAIADYKAGRITREDLTSRYSEIKNGCTEAGAILGSMIATTEDKERDYQTALQSEAKREGRPVPVVASQSAQSEDTTQAAALAKASKLKPKAKPGSSSATASAAKSPQSVASAEPKTTVKKTAAPRQGDNSLEAVAQNTQRLSESKQSAKEEQESLRKMQEEMDGTLATVLS